MVKWFDKSKGFGFVEFSSDAEAQAAVDKLNQTELDGRTIFVDIARPSEKREGGKAQSGFQGEGAQDPGRASPVRQEIVHRVEPVDRAHQGGQFHSFQSL